MSTCKTCGKKINVLVRIFTNRCIICNENIHNSCQITVLQHDKYQEGTIEHISPICGVCAEENSKHFGENRYCSTCGEDISISNNQIYCELCNTIGHLECFSSFAKKLELVWLYPHLHPKLSYKNLCSSCSRELKNRIEDIKSSFTKNWIAGTRYEYLKGYKTIRNLGRVDCNDILCPDPSKLEELLKIRCFQLGANAYVKFYFDKHNEKYSRTVLRGYSKNGNPYYGTEYYTEKWFTGYAEAVIVERFNRAKSNANTGV